MIEATVQPYHGSLLPDCAAAMQEHPEVMINCPGHEYHNRSARLVGNLLGDEKALLHVYEDVHVTLPLSQITVTPTARAA
jgi:hypothetical protein